MRLEGPEEADELLISTPNVFACCRSSSVRFGRKGGVKGTPGG
jgi:hypothetical protein